MDIDEAIDRVQARIRQEGLVLGAPVAADEIEAVEAELAPLRLPAEYRRLIERMDPAIPIIGFPSLHDLAFGLQSWREDRRFGWVARVLFTIAYTSHSWLAVELEADTSPGGELYYWSAGEDFMHLGRLPGLLAALAEAPATEPPTEYGQVWLDFDVDALRTGRSLGFDVEGWPAHWQRAEGFAPGDLAPAGATATVAQVLSARNSGPVQERIHVSVANLTCMAGESIVTVEDATGSLVLRWPAGAGPARAQAGREFELDVRTGPASQSDTVEQAELQQGQREVSRHALAGDIESAQQQASRLVKSLHQQAVDGEVTAARRLR